MPEKYIRYRSIYIIKKAVRSSSEKRNIYI